jgi:Ran GTPase-activating protein (RanGAP) involved in mRNA processing and transport
MHCVWQTFLQGIQYSETIQDLAIETFPCFHEQMDKIAALATVLPMMKSLRKLSLTLTAFDEITRTLATGISQSKLTSLKIQLWTLLIVKEEQPEWRILFSGLSSQTLHELHGDCFSPGAITGLSQALPFVKSLRRLVLHQMNFTDPAAVQALAHGIGHSKNLQSLTVGISTHNETEEHVWKILFGGLKSSKNIKELVIPFLPVEGISYLGDALPSMQSIRTLSLTNLVLSKQAALALSRGINASKLKSLYVDVSIEDEVEARGQILQILFQGMEQTKIELTVNPFPIVVERGRMPVFQIATSEFHSRLYSECAEQLLEALIGCKLLTKLVLPLDLLKKRPSCFGVLAKCLQINTSVKSLVLKGSLCSAPLEVLFADVLYHSLSVTQLTLDSCGINDAGVSLLVEVWRLNSPIEYLSLRNNQIGATGAQLLTRSIRDHPAMQRLDLSNNYQIGHEGLRLVGDELFHPPHRLTHVLLNNCITWTHYEDLLCHSAQDQESARCRAQDTLLKVIIQNVQLHVLSVLGNALSSNTEQEISFYGSLNRTGRYLLSTHHELAPAVWCYILAKNKECEDDTFGSSRIFYHLREQPSSLVQPPCRMIVVYEPAIRMFWQRGTALQGMYYCSLYSLL